MILQFLQQATNYLISQQWAMVLAVAGSGVGVSVVAQILKRLSNAESEAVIHFLVISLSIAATALQFILSNNPQSLSIYGAAIWTFSQAAYTFVVKPAQVHIDRVKIALDTLNTRRNTAMGNGITQPTPMTSLPGQTNKDSGTTVGEAQF